MQEAPRGQIQGRVFPSGAAVSLPRAGSSRPPHAPCGGQRDFLGMASRSRLRPPNPSPSSHPPSWKRPGCGTRMLHSSPREPPAPPASPGADPAGSELPPAPAAAGGATESPGAGLTLERDNHGSAGLGSVGSRARGAGEGKIPEFGIITPGIIPLPSALPSAGSQPSPLQLRRSRARRGFQAQSGRENSAPGSAPSGQIRPGSQILPSSTRGSGG